MAILEVSNLKKIYTTRFGGNQVQALSNINFTVEQGEYVAIMGESGSGKTTLLNILAALDKPTAGEVRINGKNLVSVKEKELSMFRREHLGDAMEMVDFNLKMLQGLKSAPQTANYSKNAYCTGSSLGVLQGGFDAKQ